MSECMHYVNEGEKLSLRHFPFCLPGPLNIEPLDDFYITSYRRKNVFTPTCLGVISISDVHAGSFLIAFTSIKAGEKWIPFQFSRGKFA